MDSGHWALIPAGRFEMGDHHDLGGVEHPSDEVPIHLVQLDSFYISKMEVTNDEYCRFLNAAIDAKSIMVRDDLVYTQDGMTLLCDTNASDPASSVHWDGQHFVLADGRAEHPVVCVRWPGAVEYCNWLSTAEGLMPCYHPGLTSCDYAASGYRLPSEAEWEYAARGGQTDLYRIFPWGDEPDTARVNWPGSGDPYEAGPYPWTTPVGFYDGQMHKKGDFDWPGPQLEYQTADGANGYGLYDVSGNVWEWVNDWYQRDYYAVSSLTNPAGPDTGQSLPDGKPYHVLRGGNWYNGEWGHGRVSNRDPAYYRGPDDPNHSWYHVGFRVAKSTARGEAAGQEAPRAEHPDQRPESPRPPQPAPDSGRGSQRPEPPRDRGPQLDKFQGTDSNGDGTVTMDEFLFHEEKKFGRIDTNGDGSISPAEMGANEARPDNSPRPGDQKFERTDMDANGAVSLDEYLAGERVAFPRWDLNSDGVLSPEELIGGQQRQGREPKPQGREGRREPPREGRGPAPAEPAKEKQALNIEVLSEGKLGLVKETQDAAPGYSLFAPKHRTMTYLMNNAGQVVHEWTASTYEPGQTVYLLENGNLLRCCFTHAQGFTRGGEGGRLEEYDWNDKLVWEFDYANEQHMLHHDVAVLPNGNILALAVERKTREECLAAGFSPEMLRDQELVPDYVLEIQPTRPKGGTVVWEWHVWDHLIQANDPAKANFGNVREHPERVDVDCNGRPTPAFWNHMNSIAYNPELDQIVLSVRGCSEIWIIDHATTQQEAKASTGGRYGRGGDLLYRWGNPAAYQRGTSADRMLFQQHDAHWIPAGFPGAGNILIFNNGFDRGYSSVEEIVPPFDAKSGYAMAQTGTFGPARPAWHFETTRKTDFFSSEISGAQRLANGNTLICAGVLGVFFEVTPQGATVWKYVNPVVRGGTLAQGEQPGVDERGHYLNAVFKVHRYSPGYAGLTDRDLSPRGVLELPESQKGKTGLDRANTPPSRTGHKRDDQEPEDRNNIIRSLGYL
ncbi:MAG: SUMF1/EgtB/PvdO family nonheme iron enzyme [Candidatus Hydrogenedentes bacterium]|nr:SUMF1/EgtB/PvdO family nonheme iron enzyme [Candidatus Hydrogenedentota bacterium]